MKKTAMKYGLISGSIMGIIIHLFHMISGDDNICQQYETGEIIGYTTMVLALLVIFLGVKQYRDQVSGGSINFGRALGMGMLITLVAAIIFVIFDTIYLLINPDFFSTYIECEVEARRTAGESQESIDQFVESQALFQGPAGILFTGIAMFLTVGFIGFFISLISAVILKRS